jgi:hypothetical protein
MRAASQTDGAAQTPTPNGKSLKCQPEMDGNGWKWLDFHTSPRRCTRVEVTTRKLFIKTAREIEADEEKSSEDAAQATKEGRVQMTTSERPKNCPICRHAFQGNGWDGIDAHWRSKHDDIMPYEQAWPLIQAIDASMDAMSDPEASYRRGYQQGAFDAVRAIETRPVAKVREWVDVTLARWRYLQRPHDRMCPPPRMAPQARELDWRNSRTRGVRPPRLRRTATALTGKAAVLSRFSTRHLRGTVLETSIPAHRVRGVRSCRECNADEHLRYDIWITAISNRHRPSSGNNPVWGTRTGALSPKAG